MLYQAGDNQYTQNIQIKHWNHLHQLGYINCFDVWVSLKLNEKNLLDRTSTWDSLHLNIIKTFHFFLKKLWWVITIGYFTITWNRRDRGTSEMKHHQPHQRPVFFQRRRRCVYGGIRREPCIMSSFPKTNQWIPSTAPSQTNWKRHLTKSVQN